MHTEQDKADFSQRLQTALKLAGLDTLSGANLANRFNLRHPNQPVSTQAFHHWLTGRSIPTADKIDTLAKWLDTSPEWLRHGRMALDCGSVSADELLLLSYFRALPPEKRRALIVLLHQSG
ncbi:transcriptional regulator [Neisseria sp. WLZKY-1]|uniref:transcriptional regulator n=1 Tax=Neisseria sp. WLZKY-1 TaxID=3390377 RepID=UPI00397C4699